MSTERDASKSKLPLAAPKIGLLSMEHGAAAAPTGAVAATDIDDASADGAIAVEGCVTRESAAWSSSGFQLILAPKEWNCSKSIEVAGGARGKAYAAAAAAPKAEDAANGVYGSSLMNASRAKKSTSEGSMGASSNQLDAAPCSRVMEGSMLSPSRCSAQPSSENALPAAGIIEDVEGSTLKGCLTSFSSSSSTLSMASKPGGG